MNSLKGLETLNLMMLILFLSFFSKKLFRSERKAKGNRGIQVICGILSCIFYITAFRDGLSSMNLMLNAKSVATSSPIVINGIWLFATSFTYVIVLSLLGWIGQRLNSNFILLEYPDAVLKIIAIVETVLTIIIITIPLVFKWNGEFLKEYVGYAIGYLIIGFIIVVIWAKLSKTKQDTPNDYGHF